MIKTDADGGIVVEANGTTYNLSNTESYTAFLMWITSPNEANAVPVSAFEVALDLHGDLAAKATRYSEFLKDFAQRRAIKLEQPGASLTSTQREGAIDEFIVALKGEGK